MNQEKADLANRIVAGLIDGAIQWVLGIIPILGVIAGAAYMLIRDGLFDGRSVGKKVMNLQVLSGTGTPATYAESVKRNAIFVVPMALLLIPALGLVAAAPLALVIAVAEVVMVLTSPDGRRFGDKFAGTRVVKAPAAEQAKGV